MLEEIKLLKTMSQVCAVEMWTYVKSIPSVFSDDGVFVRLVKHSMPLTHNKHVMIPAFPGKVSYGAMLLIMYHIGESLHGVNRILCTCM